MRKLIFILFIFLSFSAEAQKDTTIVRKEYRTARATSNIRIDGIADEAAWRDVPVISGFRQSSPRFDTPVKDPTEVKILYDNTAIYISAMLYDSSPDSIARQLGNRDDFIQADAFRIVFDTYNTEQDGFVFVVYASGVQSDGKFSDDQYSAVWESSVKINDKGWTVEMRIPYSALRFPNADQQTWGLQITRSTIRTGEFDQYALTPKGATNFIKYWGLLKGIENIKAPLRLSLTPYLTAYTSHYPANEAGQKNYTASIAGGLDLKYGINESFTVDATLLPDFSQVQSDNVVKNLSAFERQYGEQRPFFQEGTELFQKGGLFYSRRIGRRPNGYYDVYNQLGEGETVVKNPDQAKLLNALKVSGRTPEGLGVGVLNALLDNTYATVKDSTGHTRKVLTEPFSDYSIVVFDQQMKNSSDVYLINTNVTRKHDYPNANVTGAGFNLNNKKGSYAIGAEGAVSNNFSKADTILNQYTDVFGYKASAAIKKISGKIQWKIYRDMMNQTFDNNGLGVTNERNFISDGGNLNLFKFEPGKIFLNANLELAMDRQQNFTTHRTNNIWLHAVGNASFLNHYNIYLGCDAEPVDGVDYYEARTDGRIFRRTKNFFAYTGASSDDRKKLIISVNAHYGSTGLISNTIGYNPFYGAAESTNYRVNDKLSFNLYLAFHVDDGDRGWVGFDENGNIIFGVRKINNVENILSARYLFRNNLSLSLRARHYWSKAHYKSFYNLTESGYLIDNISYAENHDFNFNAFNVDMVFQWQFAPGSSLSLVWKNSIYDESDKTVYGYYNDLTRTFEAKELNILSVKLLYYFDYLYLKKKK